jgi:hypothetical protein
MTEKPERSAVFDAVGDRAGVRAIRLESMQVGPSGEGPALLFVDELPPRDDIAVPCDPSEADRAIVHFENRSRSVGDPRAGLDYIHPFPGWRQPLDRSRPAVPGVGGLRGDREPAALLDDVRCGRQWIIPP